MPSIRIAKDLKDEIYFVTCTIERWYYLFDRHNRWQILEDSILHCQKHKQLEVFAYVFMLNHIHMLIRSPDMPGFLRDFKKHTALELFKNLKATEPNVSRLFETSENKFCMWKKTNLP